MSRRGNAVSAIFVVALLVLSYYALRGVIRALGPCVCVCGSRMRPISDGGTGSMTIATPVVVAMASSDRLGI